MTTDWKTNGRGWTAIAIGAAAFCNACQAAPVRPRPVTHVVLMWLKHPERGADRAQLIREARSLRLIPGVLRVEAGRIAPPLGPEVDRSYDLAVVIAFRDRAALARYEKDPRHAGALQRYLQPLVRRCVIYNLNAR